MPHVFHRSAWNWACAYPAVAAASYLYLRGRVPLWRGFNAAGRSRRDGRRNGAAPPADRRRREGRGSRLDLDRAPLHPMVRRPAGRNRTPCLWQDEKQSEFSPDPN